MEEGRKERDGADVSRFLVFSVPVLQRCCGATRLDSLAFLPLGSLVGGAA